MYLFSVVLLFLVSVNIYAKELPYSASVSLVTMSMDYREYDFNNNLLDSEDSSYLDISGIEVGFDYELDKNIVSSSKISFNFMILGVYTEYIGSLRNSTEGYGSEISTTYNTIIDTDITYKRNYLFRKNLELTYGMGLGYREWERRLSSTQVELYSWYSIRPMVGIRSLGNKFSLGILLEYQYGFNTIMGVSEPSISHDFTLGGANILEISFPISYVYNKNTNLFFEAIMQKQMITESDRLYTDDGSRYYYEPESTAYNNYLKFGVEYRF